MFRQSDYQPPVLHPTYINKPRPQLQLLSQIARFDENHEEEKRLAASKAERAQLEQVVPTTYDAIYEPAHPDADWAGLVNRDKLVRRQFRGNVNQTNHLEITENGIVGSDEIPRFSRINKINYPRLEDGEGPLIGGAEKDFDMYKTSYKSQTIGEGTSRAQLTLMRRMQKPAAEYVPPPEDPYEAYLASSKFKAGFGATEGPSTSTSRPPVSDRIPSGRASFISNIADSLVHITPDPPKATRYTRK